MHADYRNAIANGLTQMGKRGLQRLIHHLEQGKPILLDGQIADKEGTLC